MNVTELLMRGALVGAGGGVRLFGDEAVAVAPGATGVIKVSVGARDVLLTAPEVFAVTEDDPDDGEVNGGNADLRRVSVSLTQQRQGGAGNGETTIWPPEQRVPVERFNHPPYARTFAAAAGATLHFKVWNGGPVRLTMAATVVVLGEAE